MKYLDVEDVGVLAEAGVTLMGENRAQQLEAKAAAWPDVRWHFIGQLQSRKVKTILPLVELIHSVASDSALAQLERHGTPETEVLVEVNVAGEDAQGRDRRRTSSRASSSAAPCASSASWACRPSPRTRRPAARTSPR